MPNQSKNNNVTPDRRGKGRMGGFFAAGPGGYCICTGCDYKQPHVKGQACNRQVCPNCGTPLIRE